MTMAKAAYWQRGESLDYKNSTNAVIEANTIIDLGTRVGVIGTDIAPNEVGSIHVVGVYEIPKTDATAITLGTAVYFDGNGITATAGSNTPAGYAAADAADADTVILVKLVG